ncbi:MAG TPA: pyridoxal-phosphate dependent enzyme [Methylomusa anaerophila]|uniref:Cysteine synthase n=1 Tax=Methylomusa anaerophila TaxID=1930071 RepID=A0A348AF23_9FIRM|nr:pyridoxal-phosphate dependent enzyme [Methylomusa anaerophila]BBB89671.1 putative cystathionine beta-synthase [Methylomusa anaerophila]HML89552.1 pyridoxal-phosphate dependent enzyme [Methylomusa anaerophila]
MALTAGNNRKIPNSIKRTIDLIGNTPLVEVTCFDVGVCRLFLKLECQNPGGSIKDRIGLFMIEQAEKEGKVKPGYTLIEATAGNTGLGLALAAITKGYKLILVIPDKMSTEKVNHLKALGAEVIITRSDVEKGHPEYYQDYAQRLSEVIPDSFFINQFNNPANPLAHELTTAPEIWEQTGHGADAIVVGVGSAGTLKGLTNYFKNVKPDLEIILADPEGSILAAYVNHRAIPKAGSWFVEGIGEDFIPAQFDVTLLKKAYSISDEESFVTARTLLRREGILAGSSSGTLISAAVKYAQEQREPKNIVTFVCDSGNKYLTKLFNDFWMTDQGFILKEQQGNLEDLITRKYSERSIITVKSNDTLLNAHAKMRMFEISQIPVVNEDDVIGIIDEWDILTAVENGDETILRQPIAGYMSQNVISVSVNDELSKVVSILKQGFLVIVKQNDRFYGLITKMDYLNYLRRKLK